MAQRAYGLRLSVLLTVAVLVALTSAAVIATRWARDGSSSSVAPETLPSALPTKSPPPIAAPADGVSTPVADPVYPGFGNPALDVQHYDLALAWSPAEKTLTAKATLTVRVTRPVEAIVLDFSRAYAVDSATVDGRAAVTDRTADDLIIATGQAIEAETKITILVAYHGRPTPGSFPGTRSDVPAVGAEIGAEGSIHALSQPYGAYTLFPCNDQPSDKALFEVEITAPAGWSGVSSGQLTSTTTLSDGSSVFHWHAAEPLSTYLLAFTVDRLERFTDTGPRGLPVTYWVRADQADRMLPLLRTTPTILAWLERRFGPYPFSSAGVVVLQVEAAMETQTMVSLGPQTGSYGKRVLAHELAHQWFGDAVTPDTWRDLWLSEGFATYAEMLYAVDQLGDEEADTVERWHRADRTVRARSGPPGAYDPGRFADSNVYVGPALMLRALRHELGAAPFLAMMHDWAQHHRFATTNRQAFTQWLADYTGRDLTGIIARWLDSTTTPPSPG
ncbi:MAG: M1 family metallopeptidase [Micromonosporaceae bacterium]|nr:M1 family metallopeptidase [Micromonosporaceae bacterium]